MRLQVLFLNTTKDLGEFEHLESVELSHSKAREMSFGNIITSYFKVCLCFVIVTNLQYLFKHKFEHFDSNW